MLDSSNNTIIDDVHKRITNAGSDITKEQIIAVLMFYNEAVDAYDQFM